MSSDSIFVAGDDFTITITAKDEVDEIIPLGGATITWGLKKTVNSTNIVVTKTIGTGITVPDAVNGIFVVTLDAADTTDLKGHYVYEAKVVDAAGKIHRLRCDEGDPVKIEFKVKIVP